MEKNWLENPLDHDMEDELIIFLQIICRIVNPAAKFAKNRFGSKAAQKIGLIVGNILGQEFYEEPNEIRRFEQMFPEFQEQSLSLNLFLDPNPVSNKLLALLESTKIPEYLSGGEIYQYLSNGLGLG
jgi:hypothetical protein